MGIVGGVGDGGKGLPVHVVKAVDGLVGNGAGFGVVESGAGDVDVAECDVLPVGKERWIFRPVEQV